MKKQVFISEETKTVTKRDGDKDVYFVAIVDGYGNYLKHEEQEDGTYQPKEVASITFKVRTVDAAKKDTVTEEEVLNAYNGVDRISDGENYEIDLSLIATPTVTKSNFANAKEVQDYLSGLFLQTALNENKDYNVQNWIKWEK